MRPKPIWIILFLCTILLLIGACPKNEPWNKNGVEIEDQPNGRLSEKEKMRLEQLKREKYNYSGLLKVESEAESEVEELKALVEEIRQNCQDVVDNFFKINEETSYSSNYKAFFKDEEKARILGKYDVCSEIIDRMEERGIY